MQFPFKTVKDRRFDVLGFGTNAVDYLIEVPKYPEFDSKIELSNYTQAAGGEIATAMVGLSRLGLRTAYAGSFGDDPAGEFGRQSLAIEGVDISLSRIVPGAKTQIAFIVIDTRNGERTVIWQRDAKLAISPADAPVAAVEDASVLHLSPHDTAACVKLAERARQCKTIVSIDIDKPFPRIDELLGSVDVLIASSSFPEDFTGIRDLRKAIVTIADRFGNAIVGVTLGEAGSLLYCQGNFIETKGFAVPGGCKDTTGAGDSFRAGFLFGLVSGESIENSARMANAVAALKCRAIGARTALPNRDELQSLLKNV
jgi:sugar/nucleoside kinase (ribokinase family)